MADAACGPSNPLQQFRKQTQLDRSLQQDRFQTRLAAAQGFRSTEARAGALDADFEAFQAGLAPAELPQHSPYLAPPNFVPAGHSGWATDFQRLAITPPAVPSHAQLQHTALNNPSSAGWAQDFRTHVAQTTPRAHSAAPSPQLFQQRARFGYTGFQPHDNQTSYFPTMQTKGKEPVMQKFDDAAFDQAFDQVGQDLMSEDTEEVQAREQELVHESLSAETRSQFESALNKVDQAAHEFSMQEEVLRNEEAQAQEQRSRDDDALAATAQELLQKVEHNTTDKFKNSQFLGLMRKLRDREVKVEGDKMVETVSSSSSSTAQLHPTIQSDSAYVSGTVSPVPATAPPQPSRYSSTEFDHWESPYW